MTSITIARPLLLALAWAAPFSAPMAASAAPAVNLQREVSHLLGFIASSGCSFNRNGNWSDSAKAEAHVRTKYDYLARNDEIASAGDFIEKAASKSSLTGSAYQVKCGGNPPVASRAWLSEELARYQSRAR